MKIIYQVGDRVQWPAIEGICDAGEGVIVYIDRWHTATGVVRVRKDDGSDMNVHKELIYPVRPQMPTMQKVEHKISGWRGMAGPEYHTDIYPYQEKYRHVWFAGEVEPNQVLVEHLTVLPLDAPLTRGGNINPGDPVEVRRPHQQPRYGVVLNLGPVGMSIRFGGSANPTFIWFWNGVTVKKV